MSEITIIAAVAQNGIIGYKSQIPWHISEDFQHFKNLTLGYPVIMGDVTYLSLPIKPLPGRKNIVLSLDPEFKAHEGVTIFNDFEAAIESISDKEKAFIIGGATIYRLGLMVADSIELTKIHEDYFGDVYFPQMVEINKWKLVKEEQHEGMDRKNNKMVKFSYLRYERWKE
jgi:dihydrofolate reductase